MQAKITKYVNIQKTEEEESSSEETEIGLISKDWKVVRLIDYCNFDRGTEPGSKSYNREGIGIPFIRVGNIAARIQELLYTTSDSIKLCSEEDILLSLDGSPGAVVKGFRGAYSSGIRKVIPKTDVIDKNFVYFILQTNYVQKIIEKYTTGVTIKHASKSLPHIKIPLPPLFEQKTIAKVLGAIQRAIEQQDKIIEAAKNLKKSLMQKLFTEGIGHTEFKETEIGTIPASWEIVKLGECFKLSSGKSRPKLLKQSAEGDCMFPVFGGNGMIGFSNTYLVDKPTLVIGRVGEYCGSIYICPAKSWITDNALYAKEFLKAGLDLKYLAHCLVVLNLNRLKKKTGQPLLTQGVVYEQKIPIASLPEQREIAHIIDTTDKKIEVEERRRATLNELFKTMLHKLMTGEIRLKDVEV